jgi:pilus assembly protein CpaE
MRCVRRPKGDDKGQVSIETLGMTPLILVVLVLVWQFVLTGYTFTLAGNAADEGARAAAVGGDWAMAAKKDLPHAFADGATSTESEGDGVVKVRVSLKVPVLFPGGVDFPMTVTGDAGAAQEQ